MDVVGAILTLVAELAKIANDALAGKITADEARAKAQVAASLMATRTGPAGTWTE